MLLIVEIYILAFWTFLSIISVLRVDLGIGVDFILPFSTFLSMISEHLLYVDLHSYQVKFCAVCYYSQPTADMNRAKKGSEDKTENILVRLYENTKDKRRRRQRNEADPKHRNPNRRLFLDTATCYRMSSTPRL